jgi:DNA-damage-inducible protein J
VKKDLIMVAQKIRTNVYLDSDMKEQAKNIFKKYGVSLSDAINMFLTQSVMERGLPFEMKIPNDETIQAIEDARNGINSDTITLEELEKESKQCLQ